MELTKEYLTVKQAAKELKVTRQEVWRKIVGKKIAAVKVGSYYLIASDDLLAYMRSLDKR